MSVVLLESSSRISWGPLDGGAQDVDNILKTGNGPIQLHVSGPRPASSCACQSLVALQFQSYGVQGLQRAVDKIIARLIPFTQLYSKLPHTFLKVGHSDLKLYLGQLPSLEHARRPFRVSLHIRRYASVYVYRSPRRFC